MVVSSRTRMDGGHGGTQFKLTYIVTGFNHQTQRVAAAARGEKRQKNMFGRKKKEGKA